MFGHQMADFHLTLEGVWHDGKFESMKKVARQQAAVADDVTITGGCHARVYISAVCVVSP
jgi:hypothetical protein